jgi:hypothetical protein
MTAFFFLIIAPIVLLAAIWIMKAYHRKKNRLHLERPDRRHFNEMS